MERPVQAAGIEPRAHSGTLGAVRRVPLVLINRFLVGVSPGKMSQVHRDHCVARRRRGKQISDTPPPSPSGVASGDTTDHSPRAGTGAETVSQQVSRHQMWPVTRNSMVSITQGFSPHRAEDSWPCRQGCQRAADRRALCRLAFIGRPGSGSTATSVPSRKRPFRLQDHHAVLHSSADHARPPSVRRQPVARPDVLGLTTITLYLYRVRRAHVHDGRLARWAIGVGQRHRGIQVPISRGSIMSLTRTGRLKPSGETANAKVATTSTTCQAGGGESASTTASQPELRAKAPNPAPPCDP